MRTLAVAMAFALVTSASAEPRYHGHGGDRGSWWGGKPRVEYHYHRDGDAAASFWGGVLGGWLGQALRPDRQAQDVEGEMEPWSEEWFNYCKRRYRSFDPETGKYLSFDGNHYFCK